MLRRAASATGVAAALIAAMMTPHAAYAENHEMIVKSVSSGLCLTASKPTSGYRYDGDVELRPCGGSLSARQRFDVAQRYYVSRKKTLTFLRAISDDSCLVAEGTGHSRDPEAAMTALCYDVMEESWDPGQPGNVEFTPAYRGNVTQTYSIKYREQCLGTIEGKKPFPIFEYSYPSCAGQDMQFTFSPA
jgi:hypothetical protein